jgi:hypothetical protein
MTAQLNRITPVLEGGLPDALPRIYRLGALMLVLMALDGAYARLYRMQFEQPFTGIGL